MLPDNFLPALGASAIIAFGIIELGANVLVYHVISNCARGMDASEIQKELQTNRHWKMLFPAVYLAYRNEFRKKTDYRAIKVLE